MKKLFRRFIPLCVLVLVLTMTLDVPAYAVTYPTAKLFSAPVSIKRGKTAKFKFRLMSGSYTRLSNGTWRSEFDIRIYNSSGKCVSWNGKNGTYFTGSITHTMEWDVPKNIKKGKYKVNYRTYFNGLSSGYHWYYNKKCTNRTFYIKVK